MTAKPKAYVWLKIRPAGLLLAGVSVGLCGSPVYAKGVEQHPAPVLVGKQVTSISTGALKHHRKDATPFGMNLSGLMIVDVHAHGASARAKSGPGIDLSHAGTTARDPALRAMMQKFVGRPLSYKLISQIETKITNFYRNHGRSLVQVTVPPQEVTSGVLQVNVDAFILQSTSVVGVPKSAKTFVSNQIRVRAGQEVDTSTLLEDVNWLNLNPFHHVSVNFTPGSKPGTTKMILKVKNGPPWYAYSGMSNSGKSDTGSLRLFGGFNVSPLSWNDAQLSYQGYISPNNLARGDFWDVGHDKGYVSHAFSYFAPVTTSTGLRFKVTVQASHVSSYSDPSGPLSSYTQVNGLNGEIAFPLPVHSGTWTMLREVYLGISNTYYKRDELLGGTLVFSRLHSRIRHLRLGLRSSLDGKLFDRTTHGAYDASITTGVADTNGQPSSHFTYINGSISQEINLDPRRSLKLRLLGQYSPNELQSLDQLALGGDATVRGYPTNDVASQTAAAASVEYRMEPITMVLGKGSGQFRPHLFTDAGFANAVTVGGVRTAPVERLASVGLGGDFTVGENFVAKIDLAVPLLDAGTTHKYAPSIAFQLVGRF